MVADEVSPGPYALILLKGTVGALIPLVVINLFLSTEIG